MADSLDLDALERLANDATPGPWWQKSWKQMEPPSEDATELSKLLCFFHDEGEPRFWKWDADGEFVATARNAVPALIARLREAEAKRDRLFASHWNTIEKLQELGEKYGCHAGMNRFKWLDSELQRAREAEARLACLGTKEIADAANRMQATNLTALDRAYNEEKQKVRALEARVAELEEAMRTVKKFLDYRVREVDDHARTAWRVLTVPSPAPRPGDER